MRTVMRYIFVGILSLLSLSGYAQNFRILDTSNGLPNNTVKCIAQDKQGFMWFGTFDGLCRFDGVNFTVFRHDTNKSFFVARNHITCILPVDNGIWVGTEYGLFFFSFDNHKFYNCSVDDSSNGKQDILGYIQNIFVMNSSIYVLSNELMVLTENYHFNKCVFKPQSLWMQATSYKDRYIIAQNFNGIFLLNPANGNIVSNISQKIPYAADVISYDEDNDFIYIGYGLGKSTQVLRIKNDRFELQPFEAPANVKSIVAYEAGVLFGTDGNGLVIEDKNGRNFVTQENTNISSDVVYSLCVDRDRNLWVGTYRGGINYYSKHNDWFGTYTREKKQLSNNFVAAIYEAPDNIFYFGLDGGGLNVYDETLEKTTVYTTTNSRISGNNVLSISGDNQYIWLGIFGGGLCRFDVKSKSFKSYSLPDEDNQAWVIRDDHKGHLWVGGRMGVYCFDKEKEVFIIQQNKVQYASDIFIDNEDIWVSSRAYGLYRLNSIGNIVKRYHWDDKGSHIPSNVINNIYIDSRHRIWFSTAGSGLNLLDEKTGDVTSYNEIHGLTNPDIISIMEDAKNCLWLGTYNGLFHFDPEKTQFMKLGKEDNQKFTQFNYNACFKNGNIMYFGTTKGIVFFKPTEISFKSSFKPITLIDFQLYDGQIAVEHEYKQGQKEVKLPYDKTFFTIYYSIPELESPDKIQFSYYLEGFDKVWQYTHERKVSYTNIPPGKYTFHIRSTNSKGEWNEACTTLQIIVTPPWWKSTPALVLWSLLSLGGFCLILFLYNHELENKHSLQLKELEKNTAKSINEAKLSFYTNITHELRTPIFLITAPLEELLTSDKSSIQIPKSYLIAMHRNAMRLNKLISRIIDFRKLEAGKLTLELHSSNVVTFYKDLIADYEALCEQKNIILLFLPSSQDIYLAFDPEKLETILSNLIGNAVKYTLEGGKITLSIQEKEKEVVFIVEDNGIGIKKEHHTQIFDRFFQVDEHNPMGDGIGLAFVKHLVELHGGSITVESEINMGSKFTFTIPKKISGVVEQKELPNPILTDEGEVATNSVHVVHDPTAPHIILVIDDEKETVEIMERYLSQDYKIVKAYNGIDGLSAVREFNPDLIICDIMMPRMNGLEFLTALREDKSIAQIPVIMFTAKTAEDDMLAVFDHGADAYLTKPVSMKFLKKRIEHLLSQSESTNITSFVMDSKTNYSKEEKKFLYRCKLIIDENLMNTEFDVILLSDKLGMSHSSLYKKIKGLTGKSVIEFINEYRIYKAVQCFMEGKTNVNQVCTECGFNDAKNFREVFKRKMGVSPRQYIQNL